MNGDSWKMLWIRHALRLGAHIVNTTKSIHPTDWSLPELERRWNERLVNVRALEEQLAKCGELPAITLSG